MNELYNREVVATEDGSMTIHIKELNENYHSAHGALAESKHVFIEAGLSYLVSQNISEINLLEVGFGTGLNFLLTYELISKSNAECNYLGLEPYPLSGEIIDRLDYSSLFINSADMKSVYNKIHRIDWQSELVLTKGITFEKRELLLQDLCSERLFNLVYFDAFAPRVQPELWTKDVFKLVYDLMAENGVLVTYCAKGQVKRDMKSAGFNVEPLPGPPGKREMTRAIK